MLDKKNIAGKDQKKRLPLVSALFALLAVAVLIALVVLVINLVKIDQTYDQITKTSGNHSNFAELIKKNPEVVAWLTVDDTHIDTVIAQSDDNIKYINTDVNGETSFAGTPFLDYRNSRNFTDVYSIIYGHKMEDHMMFGDLELFTDRDFWNQERTGTLELADGTIYDITFLACTEALDGSDLFDPIYIRNNWEDEKKRKEILADAIISKANIEKTDKIIVLSTCVTALSDNRILLFGKLDRAER